MKTNLRQIWRRYFSTVIQQKRLGMDVYNTKRPIVSERGTALALHLKKKEERKKRKVDFLPFPWEWSGHSCLGSLLGIGYSG